METWAIVVAGGGGSRYGSPKQFALLSGRPLLAWALEGAAATCDGVVAVLPEGRVDEGEWGADVVVAGGPTRSASVRAGLSAVPASAGVIAVHDAARPLATRATWEAVLSAVRGGADGAVPAVRLVDTVKLVGEDGTLSTLDRSRLLAVQTPQAFDAEVLRRAHSSGLDATDDAALVEAIGGRVVAVTGQVDNIKVTTPSDLELAAARLRGEGHPRAGVPRVGMGFDVHPFSTDPSRRLVLGGVELEGPGLDGHSDADVVAHAVADALLGGAGMGDLGSRFPSSDPALAGADSMGLLGLVVEAVGAAFVVGNVDVTLIADSPRLGGHTEEMAHRLSEVIGAPVSVKAKRAEQLGALGRSEGIACLAVAMLIQT